MYQLGFAVCIALTLMPRSKNAWACGVCGAEQSGADTVCASCHYIRGATRQSAAQGSAGAEEPFSTLAALGWLFLIGVPLWILLGLLSFASAIPYGGSGLFSALWSLLTWFILIMAFMIIVAGACGRFTKRLRPTHHSSGPPSAAVELAPQAMSFAQVKTNLLALYGSARPPVTKAAIQHCEVRLLAELPKDVRTAYEFMDGADEWTDPGSSWIRFWPIEEWISAKDLLPQAASVEDQDRLFVLADYSLECVYYAIDLKPKSSQFGSVYALGATQVTKVASSFSKFVDLVLIDDRALHSYS